MPLPAEIQELTEGIDETRFVLPRRNLGRFRGLAWIPILMSFVIGGFMVFWTVGFAGGMVQAFGPGGAMAGLVALPGFLGAASLLSLGLFVLLGHAELLVTHDQLVCIERCGLLRWRRHIATEKVEQFLVQSSFEVTRNGVKEVQHFENFACLMAKTLGGKPRWLVVGYPRDWLLGLATELAGQLNRELAQDSVQSERVVAVEEVLVSDTGPVELWEQPAGSPIIREDIPGGFSLLVPAPGVWKGSAGLFTFSLFWCGFMVIFTYMAGEFRFQAKANIAEIDWFFVVFALCFWAIGIGLMVAAINMGRRQAVIAATADQIKLMQSSLFGTSRKEWFLADLQNVQLGPSGMSVNDVPVMQLHIIEANGKKFGMLTGRDEAELEWMATHLRQNIPAIQRLKALQDAVNAGRLADLDQSADVDDEE
ncbi:hypothetical protein GC163_02935 [bacterium]|nr:hypothetical protein [bacterium]